MRDLSPALYTDIEFYGFFEIWGVFYLKTACNVV